jgi:hypothetical protein
MTSTVVRTRDHRAGIPDHTRIQPDHSTSPPTGVASPIPRSSRASHRRSRQLRACAAAIISMAVIVALVVSIQLAVLAASAPGRLVDVPRPSASAQPAPLAPR